MPIFKYSMLISVLIMSSNSAALSLTGAEQPLEHGLYDSRSCNDLYMQASWLEQKTHQYKANLTNNTRAATYALTVFSPAIYYLGFTTVKNHLDHSNTQAAINEIQHIRQRMAEKRCFERS